MINSLAHRLNSWLRYAGPYAVLLKMALLTLLFLTLSRIGLMCWQTERVSAVGQMGPFILMGIRADLILVGIWLAIPILCAPFWARKTSLRSLFMFCYVWSLTGLILVIFMELATPGFIREYDVRPNRLFVEYLKYPKEVFSTLWHGFRVFLIGGIIITLLLSILAARLLKVKNEFTCCWNSSTLWLTWPIICLLVFFCIRSTTSHRPANPAFFAITGDALVNSLIINSGYSVLYAIYSLKNEAHSSEIYGTLSHEKMMERVLDWPWLKDYQFDDPTYPTLHYQQSSSPRTRPLNLVIVLEESLGATFVASLGGLAVTPELEKLKNEGWWFEQLYATGTRSVRGIEAVISGFMPTPAQSVVKLSLAQQHFFTLATLLSEFDYHTEFIYGGEAHFDNMRAFFTSNGFSQVIDLEDMDNPEFIGSWGVSDEDLFNTAHLHLEKLHQQQKPFFSLIFTSSNHTPFEFPDGRIELYEKPKSTVNNAVKYADHALGQFITKAKAGNYWEDTIFLIVADHDNRVYGDNLVPVEKFHIPGLILGAGIQPDQITPVASQIDLAPTLLSLMGISSTHPMPGRDFTLDKTSPGRAMMQFDQYYAMIEEQNMIILRPGHPPIAAIYDPHLKQVMIISDVPDSTKVERTLAHALLPSMLYRERRYSSR